MGRPMHFFSFFLKNKYHYLYICATKVDIKYRLMCSMTVNDVIFFFTINNID